MRILSIGLALALSSGSLGCAVDDVYAPDTDRADETGLLVPPYSDEMATRIFELAEQNGLRFRKLRLTDEADFEFCEEIQAQDIRGTLSDGEKAKNSGLSLHNARWLSYFSANTYSHYAFFGQALEDLGFGDEGDGRKWRMRGALVADKSLENLGMDCRSCSRAIMIEENMSQRRVYSDEKIQFFSVGSTQAVWAEHPEKNMAILVFRGMELSAIEDILTNLNTIPKFIASWGDTHGGFRTAWNEKHSTPEGLNVPARFLSETSIKELVLAKLATVADREGFRIWIGGHSLGGAMATVAATSIVDSIENGLETADGLVMPKYRLGGVYTFGQPRVGFPDFKRAISAAASGFTAGLDGIRGTSDDVADGDAFPYLRIRFGNDVVTQVPSFLDYVHAGQSFLLGDSGIDLVNRGQEDVGRTSTVSEKTGLAGQFADHRVVEAYHPILVQIVENHENGTKVVQSGTCKRGR